MILIDTILIDEAIVNDKFSCNLTACKGACCTIRGGDGAPLLDNEVVSIQEAASVASQYLSEESINFIKQHGIVGGSKGDYFVSCIDDKDCVFVHYEGEIAKCALEKAYFEGKTSFRKPISCHLFPIRVRNFGGAYLSYQPFDECMPAFEQGTKNGNRVYESVKDALVRAYGEQWYNLLDASVKEGEQI